jgi:hypothetical protein
MKLREVKRLMEDDEAKATRASWPAGKFVTLWEPGDPPLHLTGAGALEFGVSETSALQFQGPTLIRHDPNGTVCPMVPTDEDNAATDWAIVAPPP